MSGALLTALLLTGLVVAAVGLTVGSLLLVRRQREAQARANQVVPGVPSAAPVSWAGSHDPEARLHRRLRDAVAAVRASTRDLTDGRVLDLRTELEQGALAVDESLVAVAALPAAHRAEPLARATAAVEDIEQAAADLAGATVTEASTRLARALDGARRDAELLAEARSEVERLASGLEPPPQSESRPDPGPS